MMIFVWSNGIAPLGGTERILKDTILAARSLGFTTVLICLVAKNSERGIADEIIEARMPRILQTPESLKLVAFSLSALLVILRVLVNRVPRRKVVNVVSNEGLMVSVARRLGILRIPVTYTQMAPEWHQWIETLREFRSGWRLRLGLAQAYLIRLIELLSWQNSDGMTTISAWSRDITLKLYSLPVDRVWVAYPPAAYSSRAAVRHGPPRRLLFVGNLHERKGVAYLLEAFSILAAGNKVLELVIIGEGHLLQSLKNQVKLLGLESRVSFLGRQNVEGDPDRWYSKGDILVLPSVHEGLSMVAADAMGQALPVVVTDRCGIGTLVLEQSCGKVVPARDARALADAVLEYVRDQELYSRASRNALSCARSSMSRETFIATLGRIYGDYLRS